MRIGIDVGTLREKTRGVGYYLLNLLEYFNKIATEDSFYLYSTGSILHDFSKSQNWHNRFGTIPLPGSFWLQTQGKRFIKKDQIDTFFAPAHILPLKLPPNIKKVLAIHDMVSIYYPATMANYNRLIHNLFFKPSVKYADHIITMSEFIKKSIVEYFGIDGAKIATIYEGVSNKFRPYEKNEVLSVLDRYGLKKPFILSVGTLEPRKNYPILLQAFKHLKIDYDLVVVGKKGWKADNVFTTIRNLGLENRVIILGYVNGEDMPYLYNAAEVFVFPSIYEGFGLPVLEALASGVAVVCSNSSSLPEVGGDAAIYFDPKSVDALTVKIQKILQDNQLRSSLREKGFIQARKFDWKITAQKTLAILKGN